jgi:predicted PurR-regulated permease PerM
MTRDIRPLLFAALLATFLWLGWQVFAPFLPGLVWATVLVVTFRPLHDRLAKVFRGRRWAASALVTVMVAAFVIVPVAIAAVRVVQGTVQAYDWLQTHTADSGTSLDPTERWPWIEDGLARAKELVGLADFDIKAAAIAGLKKVGALVAAKAPGFVGGAFGLLFNFVVMLLSIPVLFASGPAVSRWLARTLPVDTAAAERIFRNLGAMIRGVFLSVGLTAFVQAALGWVAMLALGVSDAFTLAAAMFFASLLPGGTAIVWIPLDIVFFATGHPWKGAIFLVWCAGIVSTIDNILRPLFAKGGGGDALPTTLLIIAMFGGLIAFGFVGLFLGPIVIYVLLELVDVLEQDVYGVTEPSRRGP